MNNRSYTNPNINPNEKFRFGFNGKEKDDSGEWGDLAHYDYGFRIYNPSIGKFLSLDPLTESYPWFTPYQFAGNTPIQAVDLDGLEQLYSTEGKYIGQGPDLMSTEIQIEGNGITLHNLLKLQKDKGINDKHKLRAIVRNQSLDKIFSGEIFFKKGSNYTGTMYETEDGDKYGQVEFDPENLDRVVVSKSQKSLDILILVMAHEYLHVYQHSTGMDSHEAQPAREVLAHHFNLFPNTTEAFDGTEFKAGKTNVFNSIDDYYDGILAHQAVKYINILPDSEKEKYSSLIDDIQNKIIELEQKGYVFPEDVGSVKDNFRNFNKANTEKRKELKNKKSTNEK